MKNATAILFGIFKHNIEINYIQRLLTSTMALANTVSWFINASAAIRIFCHETAFPSTRVSQNADR